MFNFFFANDMALVRWVINRSRAQVTSIDQELWKKKLVTVCNF